MREQEKTSKAAEKQRKREERDQEKALKNCPKKQAQGFKYPIQVSKTPKGQCWW
jgi:hypothetical protein